MYKKRTASIIVFIFILVNIFGVNAFALEEKYAENPVLRFAYDESQLPEYDLIKASDFLPALNYVINEEKKIINSIIKNTETPTFENTIEPLESLNKANIVDDILYSLYSTDSNELIDRIVGETSGLSQDYISSIFFNRDLFEKVKYVYENEDKSKLSPAQNIILKSTYYSFVNKGIDLPLEKQERIKEINNRLNYIAYNFSSNLLSSENNAFLNVTDENKLAGLSPEFIEDLGKEAQERELSGWVIPVSYSHYIQVMENAENRDLRREIYTKSRLVAGPWNEFDNSELVKESVNLRLELANIYGYTSYSDWILSNRMIGSKENAFSFLEEFNNKVFEPAKDEIELIQDYAVSKGFSEEFQIYDYYYYLKKYKEDIYSFNEESLRPYFEYENVKKGVFDLYNILYGLTFVQRTDFPVYYPEVELYEVKDGRNATVGFLYLDLFDRNSKSSGAWCASIRYGKSGEQDQILPIASISADMGKNISKGKILLSHFDLITLLHESGHAMHLLLSDVEYQSLAGFNVPWHSIEKNYNGEIINFEREFLNKTDILPVIKESVMSTRFSHIFDGGYAAGYYSYLWAWVLEADAFTEFKENGIMSREIGEKFRSLILAKGASEDPLKIYVDFTGREPSLNPLAERNGWN